MSGGGSKTETTLDTGGVAAINPQFMAPQAVTYPREMPGQLSAIGSQLAAGFGGQPGQYTAFLDSMYAPQTAYLLQQPLGVSKGLASDKPSTGNSTLDALLGITAAAKPSTNGTTKKPLDDSLNSGGWKGTGGGVDR